MEQYRRGGISECRNKALQKMFLMIGGGEQAGSGVDKIRLGWGSRHWRAPWISTQSHPDRVQLILRMVSLIPEETLRHLREIFGAPVDALPHMELQALATAEIEGGVTNGRLQELLTDHPVEIGRMLQRLCEQGFLVSDNRRRWATYRLAKGLNPPPLFQETIGDSVPLAGDSVPLTGDLEFLRSLAAPIAEKGKANPTEIRDVILKLCAGRHLTGEQVAGLLKRNPDRLRRNFLSPMVKEGLLRLRFPNAPNRPDQAYTTAENP